MEVYIELLRPVNPIGKSFITNVYGAIAANNRELIEKYKRELMRSIQKLGYKLEEIIGNGKLISGMLVIVLDDNTREPKKVYFKEVKVWSVEKVLNEKLETEVS